MNFCLRWATRAAPSRARSGCSAASSASPSTAMVSAAPLGIDAGIGARRVDQRQHRQAEALGELHQAARLAIALGPRHAEIVPHTRIGVGAFLVADDHDAAATEAADAAEDGAVLGEA